MKLSDFTQGRDNNFNLIRIVAAFAVLITHSFALAIGSGDAEPLRDYLGVTIGSIAVDLFFITSGFLVTASLLARQSIIEFLWARALRVYPALLVMLFLTIFGLGLFFTTASWTSFLTDPKTYIYLGKNSVLIAGDAYRLPGVFENNPFKYAFNGSLWTLVYEIRLYLILAGIWFFLRRMPGFGLPAFKLTTVLFAALSGIVLACNCFQLTEEARFLRLFFMFFTGASFFALQKHIVVSRPVFWCLVAALSLSVLDRQVFAVVYAFTISYILFYIAYIPAGFLRKYNRVGDYSYGIYIYAFPIQQSIVALMVGIQVLPVMLMSAVCTLLCAVLSWHFLEQHVLKMKEEYVSLTRRILKIHYSKPERL